MNVAKYISAKTFQSSKRNFAGFIIRLTAAAVALSIAVMIISICVIKGFRSQISEKVFGVWGHVHITHINSQRFEEVPFPDTSEWIQDLYALKEARIEDEVFGSFSNPVDRIRNFAHFPAIVRGKEEIDGLIIKGIDTTFDWGKFQTYLEEGKSFESYKDSANVRPLMLSRNTAQRLQLDVNDRVVVYFIKDGNQIPRRFKITGIYHTGVSEFDRKLAFASLPDVKEVMGWSEHQIGGLEIFINDLDRLDEITKYIYYEIVPNDMYARSIKNKLYPIFQWLELQKVNEYVILILMLIICVINMATGILILIFERTHLIGVLSSVGYPFRMIRNIFLYYAWYILSRGLLWGNVIAFLLLLIQYYFHPVTLDEESYYLAYAPVDFDWFRIILVNIGTIVLILACMMIPTLMIRRLDPVRALRFK